MTGLLPTPEQDALRRVVRDLVASRADARRDAIATTGVDERGWRTLVDQVGVTSLAVPESRGGAGYGWAELCVVLEEIGYGLLPVPTLSSVVLATSALLAAPPSAAADALLAELVRGHHRAALVLPLGGDAAVEEVRCSDGALVGRMPAIEAVGADTLVVIASDDDGIGLYGVEPSRPGVTVEPADAVDLTRPMAVVTLDDAPAEFLGRADDTVDAVRTVARLALAAEQVGGARACLDMAVAHATQRRQFDRPIGSFQAVKHQLADAFVRVEAAVAALADACRAATDEPARLPEAAGIATATAGEAFHDNAELNIHVHGGTGFTWEHDAHLYYRRAIANNALFGTPGLLDRRRGQSLVG